MLDYVLRIKVLYLEDFKCLEGEVVALLEPAPPRHHTSAVTMSKHQDIVTRPIEIPLLHPKDTYKEDQVGER